MEKIKGMCSNWDNSDCFCGKLWHFGEGRLAFQNIQLFQRFQKILSNINF